MSSRPRTEFCPRNIRANAKVLMVFILFLTNIYGTNQRDTLAEPSHRIIRPTEDWVNAQYNTSGRAPSGLHKEHICTCKTQRFYWWYAMCSEESVWASLTRPKIPADMWQPGSIHIASTPRNKHPKRNGSYGIQFFFWKTQMGLIRPDNEARDKNSVNIRS